MRIPVLTFFAILLLFIGCKKGSENTPPATPLKTDKTDIVLRGTAYATDSFSITYEGKWTLAFDPSTTWLKASANSGSGNARVYISVLQKNTSAANKTAKIIIIPSENSTKSVNINVTQQVEKQWSFITSFPGIQRISASGFVTSDGIFYGLGSGFINNVQQDLGDFYQYNFSTQAWARKNDFPSGVRSSANGLSVNNNGYILMGGATTCITPGNCTSTYFKDLQKYDASSDRWQNIHDFSSFDANASMGSMVFLLGNVAYIFFNQQMWAFNFADSSLTQKAKFPLMYDGYSLFQVNNIIYEVSGSVGNTFNNNVYAYDPLTDKWTKKSDFPGKPRDNATSFEIEGKGYLCQGASVNETSPGIFNWLTLKDMWEYDPLTDKWIQLDDVPWNGVGTYIGTINQKPIIATANEITAIQFENKFYSYNN